MRIVIQARMSSSRCPGKILAPLGSDTLLGYTVARLQLAGQFVAGDWQVQVATTTSPEDDATARWCQREAVPCFRGPALDVLARYVEAVADLDDEDILLRATADNPLYCPVRTAAIAACHLRMQNDYTCIQDLSYVVPEVIRVGALRAMALRAVDPYCREHVTPYFRQPEHEFRVVQLPQTWCGLRPEVRLTVDTPEELRTMNDLVRACSRRQALFPLERAYAHLRKHRLAA